MTPDGIERDVLDLLQRWAAAEQDNDPDLLDAVLAEDFVGVGPLGFVLTREQWLGRFRGGLENAPSQSRTHRCTTTAPQPSWSGCRTKRPASRSRQLRPVPAHRGSPAPRGPLDAGKRPRRPTPESVGPALRIRTVKTRQSSWSTTSRPSQPARKR